MKPDRRIIVRSIALLIMISAVIITTVLGAGPAESGRGPARAVFYVR
jgi:hypothetical protein